VKNKAEKDVHMELLVARALEIMPESEESAAELEESLPKEVDAAVLMSKRVGQVRRREVLMCRD